VQGRWLGRGQWLELLRHPAVQERFLEYTRRRWQRQREWQLVLAYGSVRARVAWQLTDLAQCFGERDEQKQEIFVPVNLTQEQQAQLVGATRARVCEALREFERKRWLICGHEGFLVRDEGALRQQSLEGL
jgi:CRP-like cAMP-binding protein